MIRQFFTDLLSHLVVAILNNFLGISHLHFGSQRLPNLFHTHTRFRNKGVGTFIYLILVARGFQIYLNAH